MIEHRGKAVASIRGSERLRVEQNYRASPRMCYDTRRDVDGSAGCPFEMVAVWATVKRWSNGCMATTRRSGAARRECVV